MGLLARGPVGVGVRGPVGVRAGSWELGIHGAPGQDPSRPRVEVGAPGRGPGVYGSQASKIWGRDCVGAVGGGAGPGWVAGRLCGTRQTNRGYVLAGPNPGPETHMTNLNLSKCDIVADRVYRTSKLRSFNTLLFTNWFSVFNLFRVMGVVDIHNPILKTYCGSSCLEAMCTMSHTSFTSSW